MTETGMKEKKNIKVIISGGGTGGHIYPAISIANAIKEIKPEAELLFVGADGKMEMEKVPAAGYEIVGLPIMGLHRRLTAKNLTFIFKLFRSLSKASSVIKKFKPDVAVGVGGYASGALLYKAAKMGIPCLIQEQNSYPGITNKLLKNKAEKICVAYDDMDRFFPAEKIIHTGNPVRKDLIDVSSKKEEALKFFNVPQGKKVVLVLGGSQGARTLNESVLNYLDEIDKKDLFLIWQCGKFYINEMKERLQSTNQEHLMLVDFISRMDLAYASADVIISRAGAGTISELCLVGKPVILVPSPNVSEDHQTRNAMALVSKDAARMVSDKAARQALVPEVIKLKEDETLQIELSKNIIELALPNAANQIASEVLNLMK